MSLREMPQHFTCATCAAVQPLEHLCLAASSAVVLRCVWCCGCAVHGQDLDPGGTVVLSGTPLQWRGLDGAAHRTRRHR